LGNKIKDKDMSQTIWVGLFDKNGNPIKPSETKKILLG
jgi:hypothetical protein